MLVKQTPKPPITTTMESIQNLFNQFSFTENEKIKLGLEIVSGMKASSYGVSIEEGRSYALFETCPTHFFSYKEGSTPECEKWEKIAEVNKRKLDGQCLFIADIAIQAFQNQLQERNIDVHQMAMNVIQNEIKLKTMIHQEEDLKPDLILMKSLPIEPMTGRERRRERRKLERKNK